MKHRIKKGDIALVSAIAVISALCLVICGARSKADAAEIIYGGEVVMTKALSEDGTFDIGGTRIEISEGHIRFVSSDCPDKTCVKSGWLEKSGESAACVPNRVVIRLTGKEEYDGVTG